MWSSVSFKKDKSHLGKFKKIEIISSIVSDHNAVRLDGNYRIKTIKNANIWRLNNTLLNKQQITEEIKSFSDKQKLQEFGTTKPALQQMLKGLI